jgi:hypothetical protein
MHTVILKMPVMGTEASDLKTLEIPEGSGPADILQGFTFKHKLGAVDHHSIIQKVCSAISCAHLNPLVWRKEIVIDGDSTAMIEIVTGQEHADDIFVALTHFSLLSLQRKILMNEVMKDNVPHTREHAFVYDQAIVVDNVMTHCFQLLDDGSTEPIDVLHRFEISYKLEENWENLAAMVLPGIYYKRYTGNAVQLHIHTNVRVNMAHAFLDAKENFREGWYQQQVTDAETD